MGLPLMPKATAVWLIENTSLTFHQIAEFCGLHVLEVQAIADGDAGLGVPPTDPIANGQLTQAEIDRCIRDPQARLTLATPKEPALKAQSKGGRYTPIARRQDRPDGILWLLKNHPELTDAQICRLMSTTKPTIQGLRTRSHWNINNIKARNPVNLGFCSQESLDREIGLARRHEATVAS